MKINFIEGPHSVRVRREAQKQVSNHIKARVPQMEMKEVSGQ